MALTISNKGGVVIPAELRKKYDLLPGTEVVIVDYGGVLAIVPALKNPIFLVSHETKAPVSQETKAPTVNKMVVGGNCRVPHRVRHSAGETPRK